jgi:arginine decarboxylase
MPRSDRERSMRDHYAPSQFRTEAWNMLGQATTTLYRRHERGQETAETVEEVRWILGRLTEIERYWAFPGPAVCQDLIRCLEDEHFEILSERAARATRQLVSHAYRSRDLSAGGVEEDDLREAQEGDGRSKTALRDGRHYFEVLVVDEGGEEEARHVRQALLSLQSDEDGLIYDVVVVPSFEDAVIAVLFNHNLQAVVVRYRFPVESRRRVPELGHYPGLLDPELFERAETDPAAALSEAIQTLRPELDLFRVTDETLGSVAASRTGSYRRVFYRQEDHLELHLSILKGIRERFEAPFFSALTEYSRKPTGVFHALPISRGKSITRSHWIGDMGRFYGTNIFLAETSSTAGGLDSLLQPTGPLKRAQERAAQAFGSRQTFFVTNGTSTANKIVTQALVQPGDIVMLSHDCHKSHPYALVLAGAQPAYLDAYPLHEYQMFGGVPTSEIKRQLLRLRRRGRLHRVRLLLLTNSTFDGVVYDPERVMREVLAIKPDMVFLWDEAWFGFARATPTYRRRTAMAAAEKLRAELRSDAYRGRYAAWKREFDQLDPEDDATWMDRPLLPDPDQARIRVYSTQSTHKTLTSLRQGSMIHVYDQDFERTAKGPFNEAYMTHTSTSPNYQILASLDVGRRQLELEGYEFVRGSVGLAMMIRKQIVDHPLLSKYYRVLRSGEMIPAELRSSGIERFYDPEAGFTRIEAHWARDEFALDPTRITVHVGATGLTGDQFRKLLIDRYDIQINKTSRNTVLFMLNIGSTRGSATYLLDVLLQIAEGLEESRDEASDADRILTEGRVQSLVDELPPLPSFSRFHPIFADDDADDTREGDMRRAFFLAYDQEKVEYIPIDGSVTEAMEAGRVLVSAAFVTPYPPGFPILVPGQILTLDILKFLRAVDVKEIHGYDAVHGLKLFTEAVFQNPGPDASPTREGPA